MLTLNTYNCPRCNQKIPIYFPRAKHIKRESGQAALIVCSRCGQLCKQKINISTAIWIWPLTGIILWFIVTIQRENHWFPTIHFDDPVLHGIINSLLYGTVSGLLFGLIIGVGIRSGYRLVAADDIDQSE